MSQNNDERRPLLDAGEGGDSRELIKFSENDEGNPRQWRKSKKMINVSIIALMSSELYSWTASTSTLVPRNGGLDVAY